MKLSEYIKGLQEILKEHGNLECYYASDDEGNEYKKVHYNGSVLYTATGDVGNYRLDYVYSEIEEVEDEDVSPICVIN